MRRAIAGRTVSEPVPANLTETLRFRSGFAIKRMRAASDTAAAGGARANCVPDHETRHSNGAAVLLSCEFRQDSVRPAVMPETDLRLPPAAAFHFGDWFVTPARNQLRRGSETRTLEPRTMSVLQYLGRRAGEVVSSDDMLRACWAGTFYGDSPVHKTVAVLRRALGDDVAQPAYIETIRKRGYRVRVPVVFSDDAPSDPLAGWTGACPFPGLAAFTAKDSAVYFGRSHAVARLLETATTQLQAALHFVLLVGTSGSGKSSLLQAGLLPLLLQPGGSSGWQAVAVAHFRPVATEFSLARLADALLQWRIGERPVYLPAERSGLTETLGSAPGTIVWRLEDAFERARASFKSGVRPLAVLVVDPLEALLDERAGADATFEAIDALARMEHVLVLGACRSDAFPRLLQARHAQALVGEGAHFDVFAPTRGELAEMIRRPALAAGLSFGSDAVTRQRLDDALLEDAAGESGALPLLQHALRELYERREDGGRTLSFDAYLRIGRLAGALAQRAEAALASADAEAQSRLALVFERMIATPDESEQPVGRPLWIDTLHDAAAERMLHVLVDARLFTSELLDNRAAVQAAHDALWTAWPRAQEWIASNRQLLRARARLAQLAARWQAEARSADFLIPPGAALHEAQHVLDAMPARLDEAEIAIVQASQGRERRRERRRRLSFAAMTALAAVAVLAAVSAWRSKAVAERERAGAEGLAGYMLGEATTRLRALGRLDILDGIAGSALAYLDASSGGSFDADRVALRAEGLLQIGEIRLVKGDAASAHEAFVRAADSVRAAASRAPSDPALLRAAGKASYWLGYEAFQRRDYALAQTQWQSYRESAQRLFDLRPDDPEAWKELGYAYNNLGTLAYRRGELDAAQQGFARSIELNRRVLARSEDVDALLDLSNSVSWAANVEDARGELSQARDHYVQAADMIARARQRRENEPALEYKHVAALFQVSQASLAIGDLALAKSTNGDAQAMMERLVKLEPSNLQWQRSMAYAYVQAVTLDLQEPGGIGAEDKNEAAIAILARLVEQQPSNSDWMRLYGSALMQRGALAARDRRIERARRSYAAANEHFEALLRVHDDDALARAFAARTHLLDAEVAVNAEAARRANVAALAVLESVAPRSQDRRVLDPWVRALVATGRVEEARSVLLQLKKTGYRQAGIVGYYDRYLVHH